MQASQGPKTNPSRMPELQSLRVTILLCVALAGCASPFHKPGITQDQFNKDRYECQQEAFTAEQNRPLYMVNALYRDCMKARGYTQ